jgi:hypothetical protein
MLEDTMADKPLLPLPQLNDSARPEHCAFTSPATRMRSFVFLAASGPEIRTTSNNSSSSGRGSPECPADGKLPCACSPERYMDWRTQPLIERRTRRRAGHATHHGVLTDLGLEALDALSSQVRLTRCGPSGRRTAPASQGLPETVAPLSVSAHQRYRSDSTTRREPW